MARKKAAKRIKLATRLDSAAAADLHRELSALKGASVLIDASDVEWLGALTAQVLMAAAATWESDGQSFRLDQPSPALMSCVELLGIPAERIAIGA